MTPAAILAILATLGKRSRDPSEREALRAAYAALSRVPMADLRALIPGSRVSLTLLEEDPAIGPWAAYIEWREGGIPRGLTTLGATHEEVMEALRESIATRRPEPVKSPEALEYERVERADIIAEGHKAVRP